MLLARFAGSAQQPTIRALEGNGRVLLTLEDTLSVDVIGLNMQAPALWVEHGRAAYVGAPELPLRDLVFLLNQNVGILAL